MASTLILPLSDGTDSLTKTCELDRDWFIGSCAQLQDIPDTLQRSAVWLQVDQDPNTGVLDRSSGTIEWRATIHHAKTLGDDAWHQTFTFRDDTGEAVATAQFSVELGNTKRDVPVSQRQRVKMNPHLVDFISSVEWKAEC